MASGNLTIATGLRTEGRTDAALIEVPSPRFAWRLAGDAWPPVQRVTIGRRSGDRWVAAWNSGPRALTQPWLDYDGPPLDPGTSYRWRVDCGNGGTDTFSDWAYFETGTAAEEWRARWIAAPVTDGDAPDRQARYFRGRFALDGQVVEARARVASLGWHRFFVNGTDVTGNALVPRWTPFDHVVEYRTHDVTALLREGANVLGFAVGDGRYRGMLGGHESRAVYGDRLAAIAEITIVLAGGERLLWTTSGDWMVGDGPITTADPKAGERADLERGRGDWCGPDAPAGFISVDVLPPHPRRLIAEAVAPVREVDRLPARTVTSLPDGTRIVDFGQNLAGVARLRLREPRGTTVTLRFSELLDRDGRLLTGYLMPPIKVSEQRDEVIAGGEDEWWQPAFTVHGFRYAAIEGLTGALAPEDVEAVVLSSDLPTAGGFTCSDSVLEQLYTNVGWTLRANLADVFTDCPTRERAGWLADAQVTAPTATGFFDVQAFFARTLANMRLEQFDDGRVPALAPSESSAFSGGPGGLVRLTAGSTGWSDAAVMLPWTLYRYYGDERVVADNYDMMRRWVDYCEREARTRTGWTRRLAGLPSEQECRILSTGFHFGEWLRPGEGFLGSMLRGWFMPDASIATAHLARSSRLLGQMAGVLGHAGDAASYAALADEVAAAWRAAFVRRGRIAGDRQDDYVRALAFDLLLPGQRREAVARLVALIEKAGDHLATGFLSTPLLLPVLADNGHAALAFRLLQQRTPPSWRYQVERGATTVWETWEGHDHKGRGRLSHNHAAFGSVAQWLREGVAGLAPAAPGFRRIVVAPLVGGGLTAASAWMDTPFGRAESGWRVEGDRVHLDLTVPPGARAAVRLGDREEEVGAGRHRLAASRASVEAAQARVRAAGDVGFA